MQERLLAELPSAHTTPHEHQQCKAHPKLLCARNNPKYAAIFAVQCNEASSIEGEAVHAAFRFLEPFVCFWSDRITSAQERSSFVSGPPVSSRALSSSSFHPAAS